MLQLFYLLQQPCILVNTTLIIIRSMEVALFQFFYIDVKTIVHAWHKAWKIKCSHTIGACIQTINTHLCTLTSMLIPYTQTLWRCTFKPKAYTCTHVILHMHTHMYTHTHWHTTHTTHTHTHAYTCARARARARALKTIILTIVFTTVYVIIVFTIVLINAKVFCFIVWRKHICL